VFGIHDGSSSTVSGFFNENGNLNIGTSSTDSAGAVDKLYVNGKTTIAGDLTATGVTTVSSITSSVVQIPVDSSGGVLVRASSFSAPLAIRKTGSPNDSQVALLVASNTLGQVFAYENIGSNQLDLQIGSNDSNRGIYWDTAAVGLVGGAVGINDDTPSFNLDVNGSASGKTLHIQTPGTGVGTMLGIDPASTSKEVILLTSSRRFKTDIEPLEFDWSAYLRLQPVTYRQKSDPGGQRYEGLIAEDVDEVYPGVVQRDAEGDPFSIDYGRIGSPTIAAVQALKRENDELKSRLERLEKIVEAR
jgi:hypothetical protein